MLKKLMAKATFSAIVKIFLLIILKDKVCYIVFSFTK